MTDDDDLVAAEWAFGLLPPDETRAAERRAAAEPAFARLLDRWQGHAASWPQGPGELPRPSLWGEIVARLPANDAAGRKGAGQLWAGAIAAMLVAALATLVMIDRRPVNRPVEPAAAPLVAVLRGSDAGVAAIAFDAGRQRLTVSTDRLDRGSRVAELWVIPADGTPRSLGMIDVAGATSRILATPAATRIAPGVTLAVSLEPIGGSPTGLPTGPVVATGIVKKA